MTMNDISTSEAYFLCAVRNKGKIFGYDTIKVACLMASILAEMMQTGSIDLSGNKIVLTGDPSFGTSYLMPVYEHLKEMELLDFKHLLQDYSSGWSDRHLNAVTSTIGNGLARQGLVTRAKIGILNGKTYFMPYKDTLPALIAELQVNIMYQTPIPVEDGFLWTLLEKSNCIPKTLTNEQQTSINSRVSAAIQAEPEGELAKLATLTNTLLTVAKTNTVFIN